MRQLAIKLQKQHNLLYDTLMFHKDTRLFLAEDGMNLLITHRRGQP
jgi:hypothetical protein